MVYGRFGPEFAGAVSTYSVKGVIKAMGLLKDDLKLLQAGTASGCSRR